MGRFTPAQRELDEIVLSAQQAVAAADRRVPERFWHIGLRIEDDAVVSDAGREPISRDVPVKASAIEALMRAAR